MIVDCVADLHGFFPELEGGDLLIVAGDLTGRDTLRGYQDFCIWLHNQLYKFKVVIAGNHDCMIQKEPFKFEGAITATAYLEDSDIEFEGLKIYGSPWTTKFHGMNPKYMAFTVDHEEDLADKFEKIPHDVDILITHSPPRGILDKTIDGRHVGSNFLYGWFKYVERPKLHVFGHVHEGYGQAEIFYGYKNSMVHSVNASHVNELYEPVNKPIRIIL